MSMRREFVMISLSSQNFFLGINDPLGGNPTGAGFTSEAHALPSVAQPGQGNFQIHCSAAIDSTRRRDI
jgi:hypothetical protein